MNPNFYVDAGGEVVPADDDPVDADTMPLPSDLMALSFDLPIGSPPPDLPSAPQDLTIKGDMDSRPAGVACGLVNCSGAKGWCCIKLTSGGSCVAQNNSCDALLKCDGREDCDVNVGVCCASLGSGVVRTASCSASCGSSEVPLCHNADASDCPSGFGHCCQVGMIYSYCSKSPCGG